MNTANGVWTWILIKHLAVEFQSSDNLRSFSRQLTSSEMEPQSNGWISRHSGSVLSEVPDPCVCLEHFKTSLDGAVLHSRDQTGLKTSQQSWFAAKHQCWRCCQWPVSWSLCPVAVSRRCNVSPLHIRTSLARRCGGAVECFERQSLLLIYSITRSLLLCCSS